MTDGVSRVSLEVGGTEIEFETGKLAKQASGSVVVAAGETKVLCTATAGNARDVDFLPLTVDVEERMYAAGKIPGSFFRREGRAGEKATLTARMIDRPLRPLFPKGWNRDTQLVSIPMSIDHEHPYDILAMNGTSAALMVSDIPFPVPVGAVRIGQDAEGNFIVNPDEEWLLESPLDLVVAGTEEAILMVEAGASEITEAEILDALDIAHQEIKRLCGAQHDLRKQAGKDKLEIEPPQVDESIMSQVQDRFGAALDEATQVVDKLERQDATKRVEQEVLESLGTTTEVDEDGVVAHRAAVQFAFDKLEKDIIRKRIAVDKKRPDGRAPEEIRDIWIEVGVAPRTHGSAIFTRGQTQAFSVAALGTTRDEMRLDTLGLQETKHYFHHYNFPPFSVGEAGFMRGPKRRDIGHGALAERALIPVVPDPDEFPYTIRVVSDIFESNGSSSMASVCGSSLSLMDAGVQITRPVAGIAMGLIKEGDDYIVLSDIAGVEDHLGDMDFKVAGTENGITALQMDIKISGITEEIMKTALDQAKAGRTHILGETGAKVDIDDEGLIKISSSDLSQIEAARRWIQGIVEEPEVGKVYTGKVVNLVDFGAFVNFMGGKDGLVHVSEIRNERVEKVADVLSEGQEVKVKVLEIDPRGKVRLSMRVVDQETGAELEDTRPPREERPRGEGRGDRDRGPRRDGGGGGRDRGPRRDGGGRGGERGDRGD